MDKPVPESTQGRFRGIIETMADGVLLIDKEGSIVYVNPAGASLFSQPAEEMEGSAFGFPLDTPGPHEINIHPPGRSARVVEMQVARTQWESDPMWVATLRDITPHKELQASLQTIKTEKRTLLDSMPEIVLFLSPDLRIVWGNRSATRFARLKKARLVGLTCSDFWKDCQEQCGYCWVSQALESHQQKSGELQNNGQATWKMRAYPVLENLKGIKGILLVAFDITRIRMMEKQLEDQSLYRTICELSGGISHDYNNFLTIINGHLELIEKKQHSKENISHNLAGARNAIVKAAALTRRFMTISEVVSPHKIPTEIKTFLEKTIRQTVTTPAINWHIGIDDPHLTVHIDPIQMSLALSQVLTNACEAMPGGGAIWISVNRESNLRKPSALDWQSPTDRFIKITIRDQGSGIHKEHLPQLFNPYFSTKTRGAVKGMGLGLTTAFAVIRKHGGYMDIHSELGKGTQVDIYLKEDPPVHLDREDIEQIGKLWTSIG